MLPPVEISTKEEILLSITADLATITAANGYPNTIALVDRQREDWDQLTPDGQMAFPFVFVNDMRDDIEQVLLNDLYRRRLTVAMVCAIRVDTGSGHGTMSTALNSFTTDVQKALTRNPFRIRNGKRTVYATRPTGLDVNEGFQFPEAVGILVYEFLYFSTE